MSAAPRDPTAPGTASGARPPAWAIVGTVLLAPLFAGTLAGYVPWRLADGRLHPPLFPLARGVGAALVMLAVPGLLSFLIRIVVEGHGTPAPFAAPRRLVTGGWFARVRNPGYLSLVIAIVGLGLVLGSLAVLGYAAGVALIAHLFVVLHEEPSLRRHFGADYERYRREVPRWLPRLGGRTSSETPSGAPRA